VFCGPNDDTVSDVLLHRADYFIRFAMLCFNSSQWNGNCGYILVLNLEIHLSSSSSSAAAAAAAAAAVVAVVVIVLDEEQRLRMFENIVLRKVPVNKGDKVTKEMRKCGMRSFKFVFIIV
jgi:hypothetical protein